MADDLRRVGAEVKRQAANVLATFYPPDADGARPIAYLWARTVRCEQPDCGCEIPLVRSWALSKRSGRRRGLRYSVVRDQGQEPRVELEVFIPKDDDDVQAATVSRAKATCPACNRVLSPDRVRAQLSEVRGGANPVFDESGKRTGGARMLAVINARDDSSGRNYRVAREDDYEAVRSATRRLSDVAA